MGSPGYKAVGITGHRNLSAGDIDVVHRSMQALVRNPTVDEFVFGGAVGADTEALKVALQCRIGGRPRLVVVVPCRLADQPYEARTWAARADEVVELGNPITAEDRYAAYHIRNRALVDRSTKLVAFWNGSTQSGTGSAVRYAREVAVEVIHLPVVGKA